MRIKKKNVARLASLSALGAGALGVAAGTAQAAAIYTPAKAKVGFSKGFGSFFSTLLTGSAYLTLQRKITSSSSIKTFYVKLNGSSNMFKPGDAAFGQTWNMLHSGAVSSLRLGQRKYFYGYVPVRTPAGGTSGSTSTVTHRSHSGTNGFFYKLFQFYDNNNSSYLYGWASFLQNVSDTSGPDVVLTGYAYDNSGVKIGAGTGTPEPSTMVLTGLAALALGATGLRRWRAVRKPAA